MLTTKLLIFRERERDMEKKKMTQKYIAEFKRAQEEWKQKEKAKMEEENRRIMAFAKMVRDREAGHEAEKREREEALGRVQKAVSVFCLVFTHHLQCRNVFRTQNCKALIWMS